MKAADDSFGPRCTYRLRRVAVATHTWIIDHGKSRLPQWRDDGGVYNPTSPTSIEFILWPYLRGDVMSQHGHEVDELRRTSMVVCPANNQTYRINDDFSGHTTLWALIENGGAWLARDRDPKVHRHQFKNGSYAVDMLGQTNPTGPGGRIDPGVPYWLER
jgi:uncharacterized protein YbaR (Trm112 family)